MQVGTTLIMILLSLLLILLLYIKLPCQHNFLTRFSYYEVYVFNYDDSYWKVFAKILVFNVNGCFACLLFLFLC